LFFFLLRILIFVCLDADIDEIQEDFPFVADQMAEWRRRILPTASAGRWSNHRRNPQIHVEEDGLTAQYKGEMNPSCIQADFGFDGKPETPFLYWEIQILGLGEGSAITMGFAHGKYDLESHPGWNSHSFALHGDDGHIFFSIGSGMIWGPRFSLGDVVGCGINPKTQEIWYTHNGKFLGIAHHHAEEIPTQRWYPTLGMTVDGDRAKANFGAYPFLFSFEARTYWKSPSFSVTSLMSVFPS
jgi:Ran-binding protein 9/10